ncbi:MAG: TIGR04283 family arsenosugar biosynthesis glycosyltransferase [Geobacteraceae bacterium]|nr:TIGR04283 family arsenosugar biosynthesis glycosyltransferase [Geobacteraceae bacterium]
MKELSVVVPVLNEAATLPELFRTLAAQRETGLELVLCDGGSTDGTLELAQQLAQEFPFPLRLVAAEPGRARQLNAGAAVSRGAHLLFLHADSLFPDRLALRKGLDALSAAIAGRGHDRVAGRFALRFRRRDSLPSPGYYHFECKARLDRPGCTHGDQGFLLRRRFFAAVGPFDQTLPMLAETRLAEAGRKRGEWLLLPAEIQSSARRFEAEGLRERQTLNAIIMNFAAAQWHTFFRELPRVYGSREAAGPLDLRFFLRRTGELMAALPPGERLRLWYATGRYVRDNAWQLALALDTRRNFRRGAPPGAADLPLLRFYDRYLNRLTDHPPGRLAAACLTWLWLRLTLL